ncbi:MAG: hypothetical protein E7161_03040 [Firmicutes bacterium]|nr:hypothetical protein [Bacillota bacterium]
MKNFINSLYRSILIILVVFGYIFQPIGVNAVSEENKTLADLKSELKVMQNKLKENENKQDKTKEEIEAAETNIGNTKYEIESAEKQISLLEGEIKKTNEEVEKLKEENEGLLVLYQKLENENIYLSYITGASSMTELIMRMDAISQLTEYNQEKLNSLELLIKSNDKMTKELAKYQVSLNKKITEYEAQIENLGDDLANLLEGVPTLEDNINDLKKSIKMYEDAGCKDNDRLATCMNVVNNTGWLRPLTKGKITSAFGMRFHPTKKRWQMHNGIDIGVAEGTKAYAPANGVVGAVVTIDEWSKYKSSLKCGGQKIYINVYVNGIAYTVVYMHMLEVYVEVGDVVTTGTVVGLTGGGKKTQSYDTCTTGAHLHYGVSKGVHYNGSSSSATKLNSNYINPPGFPSKGSWFYTR